MKRLAILVPLLAIAPLVAARAEDPATRSPAVETTHADAASVNSPLASALANGDWLPLVVESVSIDRTAPRELRKNWVVSFSGGIKARVHSPVKTFGVSAEELPGERFNVRFADCAAATNALHGTVYTGELEVHPSQNPEIPTTNTPAASEPHAESAEPEPHAESAEHRLDEVKELYATGEYAKARTRLEAVLKDEPGNERARSLFLRVVDRERREQEDDLRWQDLRRQAIKSVQPCRRPEGREKAAREEDPMATPAMLSPAEETHAESAETAEPEPHAEGAEGAE